MNKIELVKSEVIFDAQNHTYSFNGNKLNGITGLLSKWIFPNKYEFVSKEVIELAKEHGSLVHEQIHLSFEGFEIANTTEEFKSFKNNFNNITFIKSEYLVSDNKFFASSIDLIDNELNLYDIKTSYTLEKEYVSWQLSIYAYLFELQNPTKKAGKLFGLHLRDSKCKLVEVQRKSIDKVKALFDLELGKITKEEFNTIVSESIVLSNSSLAKVSEVENFIIDLKSKLKTLEETKTKLYEVLLKEMNSKNISKFENNNLIITKKDSYEKITLDSAKIKSELPDVYKKYSKTSKVKETIIIKLKDND